MSLESRQYKFEPGAHAIVQMGEELIGHPSTAINEIVKNAYDADALKAQIYVHYEHISDVNFLVVSDDGLGMSESVLFGDWLRPSVSQKRVADKKSEIFGRNLLGSKGIGRLAAMALGRYLTVITKSASDHFYNWLIIDRKQFRNDQLLSQIEFPGGNAISIKEILAEMTRISQEQRSETHNIISDYLSSLSLIDFKEGCLIIVTDLDDSIKTILAEEFLNSDLKLTEWSFVRSLKNLITPLGLNEKIQNELLERKVLKKTRAVAYPESTFELFFGSNLAGKPDFKDRFIKIEESPLLSNFDYRILGKVNQKGAVDGFYVCNRLEGDKFDIPLGLPEAQVLDTESPRRKNAGDLKTLPKAKNLVNEFYFDIRIFDRDPDSLEKLAKILKVNGRRDAAQTLDQLIGLRISKNGFGVKPYGEEEKDWLGMGEMRVQAPSIVLGVNQIIGNIFLFSPENDALHEKTNREGFFENEAFIIFKRILRAILIDGGRRRHNYRQKHQIGRKIRSSSARPEPGRFLDLIKKTTKDPEIIKEAKNFAIEIETAFDNLENSLTFSQRLASLGSGLELVYHEMAQPIGLIGKSVFALEKLVVKVNQSDLRGNLGKEIADIDTYNKTLDQLKDSLEPAIGRSRRIDFRPFEVFEKVCYLFSRDLMEAKIAIESDKKFQALVIKDYEYNLWITFLNLINNAIYWLKTEEISDRTIHAKLSKNSEIVISNNGPSIPSDELENIFNYGVTFKRTKNATGLGLAFSRSILEANRWQIWAENTPIGPAFYIAGENKHDTSI